MDRPTRRRRNRQPIWNRSRSSSGRWSRPARLQFLNPVFKRGVPVIKRNSIRDNDFEGAILKHPEAAGALRSQGDNDRLPGDAQPVKDFENTLDLRQLHPLWHGVSSRRPTTPGAE